MPEFSEISLQRLSSCDIRLQEICHEAIKIYDFAVLEGYRPRELQDLAVKNGKSKLFWPHSKHNASPSMAVDIAPYPIDWADKNRFYLLAGIMFGIADEKGIKLRWGGAWGGISYTKNNKFADLPHFEICT